MKSIQVKVPGGPEKMELVEVPKPTPGPSRRWCASPPAA